MNSEVLIIGGGVIGLAIARSLQKKGVRGITVLERGKLGREASYAAAGMLAPQSESDSPGSMFELCSESRDLYPRFAAELLEETGIDIELEQSGTLVPAFTDEDESRHRNIFEWQTAAGLDLQKLSAEESLKREPLLSQNIKSGLFFPGDWQVNNRKLVLALIEFAERNSITLVENMSADVLLTEGSLCTGVRSQNRTYTAKTIVVATGAWTSMLELNDSKLPIAVEPVRGQMISFQTSSATFRHVIFSSSGYIVPRKDGKLIVGSTMEYCGFNDRTTAEGIEQLRETAVMIAPFLSRSEIAETWSGLRPKANDELPVLGKLETADNLFIATAHFRNGILLAPITGEIIAEQIIGGNISRYSECFSPSRKALLSQKAA